MAADLIELRDNITVLDFGCGDGLFLNRLNDIADGNVTPVGFEPFMDPLEGNRVLILKRWEDVRRRVAEIGGCDAVTCFEVLEHLSPELQIEALGKIREAVKPGGRVIISVPIENFHPSSRTA